MYYIIIDGVGVQVVFGFFYGKFIVIFYICRGVFGGVFEKYVVKGYFFFGILIDYLAMQCYLFQEWSGCKQQQQDKYWIFYYFLDVSYIFVAINLIFCDNVIVFF